MGGLIPPPLFMVSGEQMSQFFGRVYSVNFRRYCLCCGSILGLDEYEYCKECNRVF